ncbi:hypothetical protein ACQEVF_57540 [Nonomuraea polychroma]|uniref:hypothetical protein n=1 Tax=Nonomuraea polychroma TaxID=46176 RepID=UPI003D89D34F
MAPRLYMARHQVMDDMGLAIQPYYVKAWEAGALIDPDVVVGDVYGWDPAEYERFQRESGLFRLGPGGRAGGVYEPGDRVIYLPSQADVDGNPAIAKRATVLSDVKGELTVEWDGRERVTGDDGKSRLIKRKDIVPKAQRDEWAPTFTIDKQQLKIARRTGYNKPDSWVKVPRRYMCNQDIGKMIGIDRNNVYLVRYRGLPFPDAAVQIGWTNHGQGWDPEDVHRWVQQTGRKMAVEWPFADDYPSDGKPFRLTTKTAV